jgi:hypothetical protein
MPATCACGRQTSAGAFDDQLSLDSARPAKIAKISLPLAVVVSIDAPSPANHTKVIAANE